ncbi:hypothetical protein B5M43_011935 [Microbacterium sp. MEC084]|uniref:hypothetical protein n=1 Tax=Microbacterium sp. MEC084 TaxID=1963027 RepID=UPI001E5374E1|nr:hypothetical protein [Microbacterium sp. MEC084]MCD1269534.1 hypothetical protein [Microbacterium sp. MEC084]
MSASEQLGADLVAALEPVERWAAEATGLPVVFDEGDAAAGGAVLLRPLSIALAPATGPVLRHISSAEVTLDVLVTVVGRNAYDSARAAVALALAAQTDVSWRLEPGPVDPGLWRALGRPPQPAFILQVPVRRLIERAAAPPVREPLHADLVPMPADPRGREAPLRSGTAPVG